MDAVQYRRYAVVGQPFYRMGGVRVEGTLIETGQHLLSAGRPDMDGDLAGYVEETGAFDAVSVDCLVEVGADGHPIVLDAELVDDDPEAALIAALAPIAFVILRGAL